MSRLHLRIPLLACMLIALAPAGEARAQEFGRVGEMQTNVAYFFHARPGEATVQVSLWGVPQPGIYEIPDSTDLDKLLTMSGGAPLQPRSEGQKRPRITVRLYRPEQSRQDPLFSASLEEMLAGSASYPTLEDDDIVVVETVQPDRFTWRDALSITSTGLSMTLLVLRIVDLRN